MSRIHFRGIMPALITPLTAEGKVNAAAVKALMDDNYAKGVAGFYVTGGTVNITASGSFDYDGTATYTGGTIIVNGQTVNSITNSMMGGMGSMQMGRRR